MILKSEGIVVSTIKYSETTIIAKIYTRNKGLLSFIIPGARSSKKSSIGNIIQPTNFLDLTFYYQDQKKLLKIKECRLATINHHIIVNFLLQSIAIFYLEIISKCLHENEIQESLFDFIKYEYQKLENSEKKDLILMPLNFMLGLSSLMGFYPNISKGNYFDITEGVFVENIPNQPYFDKNSTQALSDLMLQNTDTKHLISHRKQLLQDMLMYFQYHIPNFGTINSIDILHQVLVV
jgi:DNA repair protein RecO (recombination protein O)